MCTLQRYGGVLSMFLRCIIKSYPRAKLITIAPNIIDMHFVEVIDPNWINLDISRFSYI